MKVFVRDFSIVFAAGTLATACNTGDPGALLAAPDSGVGIGDSGSGGSGQAGSGDWSCPV